MDGPEEIVCVPRELLSKHGLVVMAHRGGDWSADNSIENFKAAL